MIVAFGAVTERWFEASVLPPSSSRTQATIKYNMREKTYVTSSRPNDVFDVKTGPSVPRPNLK